MKKEAEPMLQNQVSSTPTSHKSRIQQKSTKSEATACDEDKAMSSYESGRERLKRHRVEVAGQVWIPDIWGQEKFLQDWTDCSSFDSALAPNEVKSARASLVAEGRRAHSGRIRVEKSC